jgi:hypothetical protein
MSKLTPGMHWKPRHVLAVGAEVGAAGWVMGEAERAAVGVQVNVWVGDSVGKANDPAVGAIVGVELGEGVGEVVGARVGTDVGASVGLAREPVGSAVGCPVDAVGIADVGCAVVGALGAEDSALVGATVGAPTKSLF